MRKWKESPENFHEAFHKGLKCSLKTCARTAVRGVEEFETNFCNLSIAYNSHT